MAGLSQSASESSCAPLRSFVDDDEVVSYSERLTQPYEDHPKQTHSDGV